MNTITNFVCRKCGNCCKRGFVYIKKDDIKKISTFFRITQKDFINQYTENILWLGRVLKFKGDKCIFLNSNNLCLIYNVRPLQCRTFPGWGWIVKKTNWQEEIKDFCEGTKYI